MWSSFLPLLFAAVIGASATPRAADMVSPLVVVDLRCEYSTDPLGVQTRNPRLSWRLEGQGRDRSQSAYQIIVASSPDRLMQQNGDVWDSGRVASSQSVHVPYAGPALQSRERYYWKVRVWDEANRVSEYSGPAWWEMALLEEDDWTARWISNVPRSDSMPPERPAPYFRREFETADEPVAARLYISGLGYYEAYMNGRKIGDHVLDPVLTRYDRHVKYVVYDVTAFVHAEGNTLGAILGNGWYNQHTRSAWDFDQAPWRAEPALLAQLELHYDDGTRRVIATDSSWKTTTGPIVFNGIRNGETYDARLELDRWAEPGYDDSGWDRAHAVDGPAGRLSVQVMPPIRIIDTRYPVRVDEPSAGVRVYDFGQNLTGWARIRVRGPAGSEVTIRYGERVHDDGTLDQKELSRFIWTGETQTDRYILRGSEIEAWHPRFVYHGFQYAEVTTSTPEVEVEVVAADVVHTDLRPAGRLDTSNDLINRIQQNLLWSYLGNFHGYPTDCPHREKIGWTGDAVLAAQAGLFNFESTTAYLKWLDDFVDEQRESGQLPGIIPTSGWGYTYGTDEELRERGYGPQWEAAFVFIPWYLYRFSGDAAILTRYYPHIKDYIDYLHRHEQDGVLPFGIDDHKWIEVQTEAPVVATATYYGALMTLTQMAAVLGRHDDEAKYRARAVDVRDAFNRRFFNPAEASYDNGTQTPLALALYYDLVPADYEPHVLQNLVEDVEKRGVHLIAGVVGTRAVLEVLLKYDYHDLALEAITQTNYPGWGYWVAQGATTLWQNWDGSQSRNHIMFGSVGEWFYKALGGIRLLPGHAGFSRFRVEAPLLEDLEAASVSHRSPYGMIESSWRQGDGEYRLSVRVPVNTTALISVPAPTEDAATGIGVRMVEWRDGRAYYEVGSGRYEFVVDLGG